MKTPKFSLLRLKLWPISLFVAFLTVLPPARATSGTWTGNTDSTWAGSGNWNPGTPSVPGSGNTATFNGAGNGHTTITTATITIGSIVFDTSSAAAYTLGGASAGTGQMTLQTEMQMTSTVTNNETNNALTLFSTVGTTGMILDNDSTSATLIQAGNVRNASSATGTHTLTVSGAGNTTISGEILNNGGSGATGVTALTKTGAGTLTLSNSGNSYSGATTVNGGVLAVTGALTSATTVTVGGASAANTPTLTGSGTVGGGVTISSAGGGAAGTINPGSVGGVGTLTVGSISFQDGSTLAIDLTSGAADKLTDSGTVTFAGTDYITFSGSTGATATTGAGDFQLMTIGSGTNLTTGAFTGTAPTYYRLLGSGTSLDLVHQGTISISTPTTGAPSIIIGGSTGINFSLSNTAPTNSSNLSATPTSNSATNTTGSISGAPISVAVGTPTGTLTGISFTDTTTTGANQTGSFTVTDGNADNSGVAGSVTVNVYGHANPTLNTTTLNLGNIHAGYSGTVTSNSLTATNSTAGSAGSYIVNLKGSGTTSGGVSLNTIAGVAPGSTASIAATLANGQGAESFANQTYTFADDSTLNGASSSLSPTSLTVSGEVYTGASTWVTSGSGSWGTLTGTGTEVFNKNWGTNQGSPGLDSGFKGKDTASFGAVSAASATVYLNAAAPNLNSITFGSPSTSYTLAQQNDGISANSITLSGTTPSINVTSNATSGSQTISAPLILGANTSVNVGSKQTLNLTGVISDPSASLTYTGPGTTITTADNTYTGGTTITGGTLYVNNGGGASYSHPIASPPTAHAAITANNTTGSGTGTGSVAAGNGTANSGTLAGSGTIATSAGVTIYKGGTLASGADQTSAAVLNSGSGSVGGTGLTLNNTPLTVNGGATLTFALGSSTLPDVNSGALNFANPNTNSTYMSLTSSTADLIFSTSTTSSVFNIDLVDLTYGVSGNALTLRAQNPYLLIQTALGGNDDFANLMTTGGLGQNGFVLGVENGSNPLVGFNVYATNINGSTISTSTNLQNLRLYLYNGDLEVVPEPGTWALMLGGLGMLILWQRRRANFDGMGSRPNRSAKRNPSRIDS